MTGPTSATPKMMDRWVHADVTSDPLSARLDRVTDGAEIDGAAGVPVIRALPPVRARWRRDADVVVVGSGAAGISAALTAAASGLRVLIVTKDLIGGATPLAQGGLAAAIGPGDSAASHVSDTLTAGAGLCEPDVVASLAAAAPGVIDWLAGLGARLDTRELRLEGGHSHRRIVHSGDDATGAEVHRVLLAALLASGVEILDRTVALELMVKNRLLAGVIGADGRVTTGVIHASAVVIAAGGLGQDEGQQRAQDRYPGGEQQGAAQAERGLQDREQEHPDERAELADPGGDPVPGRAHGHRVQRAQIIQSRAATKTEGRES